MRDGKRERVREKKIKFILAKCYQYNKLSRFRLCDINNKKKIV